MTAESILLTGSSGLIGTSLIRSLATERISFISLSRSAQSTTSNSPPRQVWRPYEDQPVTDARLLDGATAAIHLSGVNLAGRRWSPAFRREILQSRVTPTAAIATLLAGLRPVPSTLVCASAIGIYGDRGKEVLTEASAPGSGFLPEVCLAWEKAAKPATDAGIRVVHLRFGVVLSPAGGALKQMLPVFRAGLGGRLGSGRQWISWITLHDAVRAILFVLRTPSLSGPVNVVAPNPVSNLEFTRSLGRALHRPALLPVPVLALRAVFGQMADATILSSARVVPACLSAAGFNFEYPELDAGLDSLLPGR